MKRNYTDIAPEKLSETTSFHMELLILLLILTQRKMPTGSTPQTFNLPVIKCRVHKYPQSSGCAQRSVYFLLEQQVSDFDSSKNKFQIFLSENKKFVRDILALSSPIISLCVKMNTSICISLPEKGSLLLLETNVP